MFSPTTHCSRHTVQQHHTRRSDQRHRERQFALVAARIVLGALVRVRAQVEGVQTALGREQPMSDTNQA
jgi:hypothetical protein